MTAMTQNINDLSADAVFQLRLQQAILVAQHTIKQVGLLLVGFDCPDHSTADLMRMPNFSDSVWTRLRNTLRDSDTVVRRESGEMAVLLPSVNGAEDVVVVAKKVLSSLQEPILIEGLNVDIQPRVGIALFPEHTSSAATLMHRADNALDSARRNKSSYTLYSHAGRTPQKSPLSMGQLRQAIVADQLFLLYQPKISLKEQYVSGLEVLTRWQQPDLGLISPDEFIPVAERTGMIIPLTLWVLKQSLLQCRAWREIGIDMPVAVNLSMWNLDAQELPDQISSLLQNTGISADRLELEITESAIMGDPQRTIRTLSLIRDLGVRFAIDDFGTGYSSLAYLKKLPVSSIKIDKSFVKNMEHDRDNAIIVRSIIDLGHNLGLKVVAEGVETQEAQDMLRAFDCDEVQGYYHSRPIPADAVLKYLNKPPLQVNDRSSPENSGAAIDASPVKRNGTIDPKLQRLP
jgi:EAL domain-containing protein (putative c-di-GMP-specific phosphodiesterase class I)